MNNKRDFIGKLIYCSGFLFGYILGRLGYKVIKEETDGKD